MIPASRDGLRARTGLQHPYRGDPSAAMHGDSLLLPSVSCRAATAAVAGARWALRLGFAPGCRDVAGKRSEQRPGIFAILVDLLLGAAQSEPDRSSGQTAVHCDAQTPQLNLRLRNGLWLGARRCANRERWSSARLGPSPGRRKSFTVRPRRPPGWPNNALLPTERDRSRCGDFRTVRDVVIFSRQAM
jgi:hypothetical protein